MGDDDEQSDPEFDEAKPEQSKEAKQLDSITDFVEDREDGGDSKVDTKEVEARLNDLRRKKEETDRQRQEREKQLALVKIKKEDLDLMCSELPLCDREALERLLREHDGDLVTALKAAVRKLPTCN
mmetsp:Transcript_43842/g.99060  ORF Transcript_43842/g.99060 Transcript_43842/m.99060 type:complete len:126 (+) Transcript_43842:121-498(+)